jgi:uncharacterized FlaG/YvyC family protein
MNIPPVEGLIKNLSGNSTQAVHQSADEVAPKAQDAIPTIESQPPATETTVEISLETIKQARANVAESDSTIDRSDIQEKAQAVSERINDAISELNARFTNVKFHLDQDHDGAIVMRIVGVESGEQVRQIPAEEVLDFRDRAAEFRGLVFDNIS